MKKYLSLFLLCCVVACNSGGGGDDGGSDGSSAGGTGSDSSGLASKCGVVAKGKLYSPIDSSRGKSATLVSVLDSNALILNIEGVDTIVKLHGVGGTTGFHNTAAEKLFAALAVEPLFFFQSGDCTGTVDNDKVGVVGNVVTASGKSFTEELILAHYAGVLETTGTCNEASVAACYQSIADSVRYHNTGTLKDCDETPPSNFRYRPSDTDCGGNSSVVLTGSLFDTFSIQERYPDGTDRLDEDCETNSCSAYKTQDTIRVDGTKVLCFGTPGNSVIMSDMNHVSIKREADDHDPLRYCVADPKLPIN
ncbi:MAG: hypothetical protein KBC84_01940 [Proteobacteria bacterium]|nr:hypothetical protein [Pseudomonadota bacterium]